MQERDSADADADPTLDQEGMLDDEHASDPEVIEADPSANPDEPELKDLKGG